MKRIFTGILGCMILCSIEPLCGSAAGGLPQEGLIPGAVISRDIKLDVPFVPTTDVVVAEMIAMADVSDKDIVYDLGCGDGRIVISAARDRGVSGVGVDIHPELVMECRRNAVEANVADKVVFKLQDLFQAEIGGASVVMLYLLPDVNLKLRPKLLRDPGNTHRIPQTMT